MLDDARFIFALDVREGMRTAAVANQQRIALGKVARTLSPSASLVVQLAILPKFMSDWAV